MGIPSPLWGWEALLIYTQNNTRRLRTETSPLGSPVIDLRSDITKVVIAFSFSVEHYITSSTIICGRHFYFWLLVRLWLLWAIGYDDRKLRGKKGNFILFRHGESYLIRTI